MGTRARKLVAIGTIAIGMIAMAGAAAPSAESATPIDDLVDCTDSFWAVTCTANAEPGEDRSDLVPVRIDNDPVCTTRPNGFIVCHT